MIEINLLPGELKAKTKKKAEGLKSRQFLYIIPFIFAIFLLIHIFLFAVFVIRSSQLTMLKNKWNSFQPRMKDLEAFRQEYAIASGTAQILQNLVSQRVNWSVKLGKLSLYLPSGVWFTELNFLNKDFSLRASVISLQKEEFAVINKFMQSLKADPDFSKEFAKLELGSVQQRNIGGYDIIDFTLSGNLR